MSQLYDGSRADKLYLRALNIREAHACGLWEPIMWHLALRGHVNAMVDLAHWLSESNTHRSLGIASDAFSAAGLYRRAYRRGDARAAYSLAMSYFNRNDMGGYRAWVTRAGRAGDGAAAAQARHFETRLPHGAARKIGRQRPEQKRDEFA